MKRTKVLHTNRLKFKDSVHKIFLCLVMVIFATQISSNDYSIANAAHYKIHNHVTQDTYNYSGTQVQYSINGELITTDYPGIVLKNGAAVGPYKEVFEKALGTSSDYIEGKTSFTISYGPNTIKMTLGNTEAIVNGQKHIMNNPPFVYSFNDSTETYLFVPTRFVAETLGFIYSWNSSTSIASIQRSNIIYDGTMSLPYTGNTPAFSINGKTVESDTYPGYFFDNSALFEAKEFFQDTGLATYTYAEGSGLIVLQKGNCVVRFVLDSPVAYINDDAYLLDTVPRLITPQDASTPGVYIPARFAAEALGYTVTYHSSTETLCIAGEISNLSPDTKENSSAYDKIITDTASYGDILFSYKTHEQILSHYKEQGHLVPEALNAYSCINSDALYLKGVDESKVQITDKADVIEILLTGYHNTDTSRVCFNPDAAYLNYCYISGTDSIKILLIKSKELHYYTYSAPDGCVIHFTDTAGMYQDYLTFAGSSTPDSDKESGTTDILGEEENGFDLPEAIFTRKHFVIRLPEGITPFDIKDFDDYHNKRFTVSIPGNHMKFLSEQETYNPVSTLKNVQFSYKVADNTTVMTFNTTKIQGYSLTTSDGFLAVQIDNPREIYDKIIVLDAGHGGIDPGTSRSNVYEKNVNFNVINVYAPEYFKGSDIKVYYTRTTDTKIALQTRASFAASVDADLFISFHVNAHSNSAVNGTSVYYSASNNKTTASGLKSSLLAKSVVDQLAKAWNTKNRGILTEKFVVVHNNTVPAVLVECGFITNDSDLKKVKDTAYQKKAAKALFDAVTEIFDKYPTKR